MARLIESSGQGEILYDHQGKAIVNSELKAQAAEKLTAFIQNNKRSFDDWFLAHGIKRPPIFYDTASGEWVWMEG